MPLRLFGGKGNEEKKPHLPPTQSHIPVSAVQDGVAIIRLSINKIPSTTLTAILEVGALDITRLSDSERGAFIARYTDMLRGWRFPYQFIIGRRRQDLDEFLARGGEQVKGWQRQSQPGRAQLLAYLLAFMEQVATYSNPQVPAYYVSLPYVVPTPATQMGRVTQAGYQEGLQVLADRARMVQQSFNQLGLGVIRLDDQAMVDLLYHFYHPNLPVLWLSPQERIVSLLVRGGEDGDES
ncbi:MAG: hypothetical protein H8E35_06855 [Ardenticatenia bacterium]|nr:hypothetical protein [Ardenticatenia bacterium]